MQSKLLEQRDRRVAVVHEMLQARLSRETLSDIRAAISWLQILRLQAMGTLKVYGWESVFAERIHQLRLQVSCVWYSVLLHRRCVVSCAIGRHGLTVTGNENERLLRQSNDRHPGAIGAYDPRGLRRHVCAVLAHGAGRHTARFGTSATVRWPACAMTWEDLSQRRFLPQVIFPALSLIKGLQVTSLAFTHRASPALAPHDRTCRFRCELRLQLWHIRRFLLNRL
jgi:hypothetical protein